MEKYFEPYLVLRLKNLNQKSQAKGPLWSQGVSLLNYKILYIFNTDLNKIGVRVSVNAIGSTESKQSKQCISIPSTSESNSDSS